MGVAKVTLNGETLIDVTQKTVTSSVMLSPYTALDNAGEPVTGTISERSSTDITVSGSTVTIPAGLYGTQVTKSVASTTHPAPTVAIASATGIVTATHVQGTGYVTGGTTTSSFTLATQAAKTITPTETAQTAVSSYYWTTGNISVAAISSTYVGTGIAHKSSADLTASGSTVTVPAGYYSAQATKNIAGGTATTPAITITKNPTVTIDNATGIVTATYTGSSSITPAIVSGYISAGTAGTVSTTGTSTLTLTTVASSTWTPGTTVQIIPSHRWLAGTQTIKGDANLVAANIVSGKTIFGVSGTAQYATASYSSGILTITNGILSI